MINNDNLIPIPAKRYFSIEEACQLAGVKVEELQEWQRQESVLLNKGGRALTRLDVIKLRQLRHSICDYFSLNMLDENGNHAITASEMRIELENLLAKIEKSIAK